MDENFFTVYSNNKIYTISKNTGTHSYVRVGDKTALGQVLTQAEYDRMAAQCTDEGQFEI